MKVTLAEQERNLRKQMEPHTNRVTEGKALVLWRKLLEQAEFPDMTVCDYMENGVRLTGAEEESQLYTRKFAPATMTVEQLNHQAIWRRRALMGKPMTDDELEQEGDLLQESLDEVSAGFLEGPYSELQITDKLGTDQWSLTKRFCLYQGEERKIRVIDNYKDSGINAAFLSSSYLALQDTDFIVGFLRFLMVVLADSDRVVIHLSTGEVLQGPWHDSMSCRPEWLGRCIDLSKAYKQVPIHKTSLQHGVLGFCTKAEGWKLFTICSLPFGASAAVFAFNKISRGIWHLLVHKFGFLTSVFYDDYPVFEVGPLCELTSKIMDSFLNVLGWRHAVQGKKAVDFGSQPIALGVQYNLELLWRGELVVKNKPGRLERILELIREVRNDHGKDKSVVASLAGLMNFAGGFVLGHQFKLGTHALNSWAHNRGIPSKEDSDLPWIIYSDGAFENLKETWGALVFDPLSGRKEVYAGEVPDELISFWLSTVGDQLICEIELYAYICVRWRLRKELSQRYGIAFTDNEASRMTLIKRSSPSLAMFLMVSLLSLLDAVVPFSAWCERVASASSPSDLPSRGRALELCEKLGAHFGGEIDLPPCVMKFMMRDRFDLELAQEVRRFV
eukprot:s6056_g1.t1